MGDTFEILGTLLVLGSLVAGLWVLVVRKTRVVFSIRASRKVRVGALKALGMGVPMTLMMTCSLAVVALPEPRLPRILLWAVLGSVCGGCVVSMLAAQIVAIDAWIRRSAVRRHSKGQAVRLLAVRVTKTLMNEYARANITQADALKSPSTRLWYQPAFGRKLLFALIVLLGFFGVLLQVTIADEPGMVMFRNWAALYGVSLVFSVSSPFFITWIVTVALTGQPRLRYSLQRLRGCAGMGTSFGLLLAIAAFYYIHLGPSSLANRPALPYDVQTFLLCATLGTVVGLTVGMTLVAAECSLLLGNRYLAAGFTMVVCAIAAAATASIYPPKKAFSDMIDGVTAGVPRVPIELVTDDVDWKTALASNPSEVVSLMVGPWTFIMLVTLSMLVAIGAMLHHWHRQETNVVQDARAAEVRVTTSP